jgi:hypothetical protein
MIGLKRSDLYKFHKLNGALELDRVILDDKRNSIYAKRLF